jgi:hypothetical protein
MTSPASLNARLRKIESLATTSLPAEPWVWVITDSDDELPGKLAEMEAAGTYRPDRQGVVHWRIVDVDREKGIPGHETP